MIYAVGDVHGVLGKLQKLIARCEEHADGRPMTLIFLGDYIDRGPEVAGVVRCLIDLERKSPERVIPLMGNHEMMVLAVIDGVTPERSWLVQGGAATLASYGVSHARELPAELLDWLETLRLAYDDGRRFFVHAGINPDKPLDAQNEVDLLWIRNLSCPMSATTVV
jgi:serine/threonine protein phosphatase 1